MRIEVDSALDVDPAQIEALLPGELAESLGAEADTKLGLAELAGALGLQLDELVGGGRGWGLHLAAAVVATLLALLVAGCCLPQGALAARARCEAAAGERDRAREREDGREARERRIRELREKERLRAQERERQREADMSEAKARGEPKGDKGPKNPKSSAASQDIHVLARKGNLAGLRRLLERGTSVDVRSKESQKTPLHVACQFGQLNAVKMLHESFNADIEARTVHGRTPLHLAAAQGFHEVVEYLISRKADTTALTPDGQNALHLSQKYSYKEVETVLTPR